MANNKQAEKRNRQRERRHLQNRLVIGRMRTAVKAARAAIESGDSKTADIVRSAISAIDKAVTKGVVKRPTASRLISRIAKRS